MAIFLTFKWQFSGGSGRVLMFSHNLNFPLSKTTFSTLFPERIEMEKNLFLNKLSDDNQPLGFNAGHVQGKWFVDSEFKPSPGNSTRSTRFQV